MLKQSPEALTVMPPPVDHPGVSRHSCSSGRGIARFLLVLACVGWWIVPAYSQDEAPSIAAADALWLKIGTIMAAEADSSRAPGADAIVVSEIEMESFVRFYMQEDIPPRLDSIDVGVEAGEISALAELTFDADNRTGNVIVDTLFQGTHTFYARGALRGTEGRGRFELLEVRVDDYPVPLVVIDVLIANFVTPRYPDVDLDAPFAIPWGIEEIRLAGGRADLRY